MILNYFLPSLGRFNTSTIAASHSYFAQHPFLLCTGGHFTEPNEQKTQQSPLFGRNTVLQLLHS